MRTLRPPRASETTTYSKNADKPKARTFHACISTSPSVTTASRTPATQAVLNKLGVNSRLQAAACAVSYGLVKPPV